MRKRPWLEASVDHDEGLPQLKRPSPGPAVFDDEPEDEPRLIDFSSYSGNTWYSLNKKYKSSKGSAEYERAFDACSDVKYIIKDIRRQATAPDATFHTKHSALETLQKIGKSILMAPSTLGAEVRKKFQYEDCLEDSMKSILLTMDANDIRLLALSEEDDNGPFIDKVTQLMRSASANYIMEGLDVVVQMLDEAIEYGSRMSLDEPDGFMDAVPSAEMNGNENGNGLGTSSREPCVASWRDLDDQDLCCF